MDTQKLIKGKTEKKIIPINIKVTQTMSEWLKKMDYSPTRIFGEACKQLGFKE